MKKHKATFVTSLAMCIGLSIFILISYGLFLLTLLHGGRFFMTQFFITVIMPSILPFTNAQRWFTVIKLDNNGVTQLLLGLIKIRKLMWKEVSEIRFKSYMGSWVFFSRMPLNDMPYANIVKRKDVIQVGYSNKLLESIREYTDQKIIGYNDITAEN